MERSALQSIRALNHTNGASVTDPNAKARQVDNMRRIADGLTNPKDAALVRAYANELAEARRADR